MLKFHKKYKAWHQLQYYVLSAYASDKNLLMENFHWDTVGNLANFASSYSMLLHVKSDPLIDLKKTNDEISMPFFLLSLLKWSYPESIADKSTKL